jgi:hypothetical protein
MAQKFPEIGLRIVLDTSGFQPAANKVLRGMRDIDKTIKQTAQSVNESGKQMTGGFARSLEELIQKSEIAGAMFSSLPRAALNPLKDAFVNLGDGMAVNAQKFDQLVESGTPLRQAFEQATQEASSLGEESSSLGETVSVLSRQFTTTAVAIGVVTAAIKASISLVRRSISEYNELAEATRRLRSQTGLLSREASQYVQAFQAAGLSSTSAARGLSQFLNKVTDLNRDLKAGKDNTSDFATAMEFLDVSITDGSGNLKDTEQLLTDVNAAFQRLGPGVRTAEAAQSLFGIAAYRLLPLLTDQHVTIQDLFAITERYSSSLGALTQQQYAEFELAQFELRTAMQSVYNHIATQWIPVLTQIYRVVANVIGIYRQLVSAVVDLGAEQETFVERATRAADALEWLNDKIQIAIDNFRILMTILSPVRAGMYAFRVASGETAQSAEELADAEEEAAQGMFNLRQAAADVVPALKDQMEALDELKAQLRQKMDDIAQDAEQGWNDILVKRARAAFDRSLQNVYRMDDLRRALNDRLDDIEADFAKRWDDIFVKRAREAWERAQREIWQDADLGRRRDQSRADAIRDAADREREIQRDARKRSEDAERDAREKREKLERDHLRRLRDIRQQFLDTALEAARDNDAVAVAQAMRRRARELRDEQERYQDEQRDLAEDLKRKREAIQRDRQERESDHRQELARRLQRIEENHQRQVAELERQRERERIIRAQQEQWELDDLNKAKAEQLAAAQEWYDKQIEEMKRQQAREEKLRQIQYERQEIDFVKNWQRRIEDAREWYARERDELAEHLDMTGQMLERAYEDWIRAAGEAVSKMTQALLNDIQRWQHALTEAQRQAARISRPPTPAPTQRQPGGGGTRAVRGPDGVWRVPGAPIFGRGPGMADGGVVQASSPTTVTMGEAGPETAVFMPGRPGSLNVNHSFGRLGVDFEGVPGGMNTQQVQAIVYSVMTQLAKGIQIPR